MPPAPHEGHMTRRVALCAGVMLIAHLSVAAPAFLGITGDLSLSQSKSVVGASVVLVVALVALSTVDWLTFRLPDAITLPLAVAGVIVHWDAGQAEIISRLLAAFAGFGLLFVAAWGYEAVRGRAGLGLGDAKLYAAAGAWLGFEGLASVMLYAALAALLGVAVAMLRGHPVGMSTRLPFGPFLAIAIWIVWIYGPIGVAQAL